MGKGLLEALGLRNARARPRVRLRLHRRRHRRAPRAGAMSVFTLPRAASETPDAGRLPEPWRLGCSDGENWGRG